MIVKGVSVPKNCYTCAKYRWSPLCPCWRGDAEASYYRTRRHPDCPLVEVPTPHGRLIDADAMCNDLATVDQQYAAMIDWCIGVTEVQPTIIEAEGKKNV